MFRAPVPLRSPAELRLFDAAGNLVRSFRANGGELAVPLAGVKPGLYFCALNSANQKFITRLLVVK